MKKVSNSLALTLSLTAFLSLTTAGSALAGGEGKARTKQLHDFAPNPEWMQASECPEAVFSLSSLEVLEAATTPVKVYDRDNNLIAEGSLNGVGLPTSPTLQQALRHASPLMTYQGVQYYRAY